MADVLTRFLGMDVPMWVVIVIAIVQAISLFRTLWATLKQINRWLRALSNYGANLVRRWLGVPKQITMTKRNTMRYL
jgi:hypothetical protein